MVETATGLVLRTRPLTETSLIVHWLTPNCGRLATVAKGARRPKSPFRGKLDLFYHADFSFVRSRRSELHTLREVGLRETHSALRQELAYLRQASYAAALLEQTTEMDTPLSGAYELLCALLDQLPRQPPLPRFVFAFELKLLNQLGLQPDWDQTRLNPGAMLAAKALAETEWTALAGLQITPPHSTDINRFLHGFLIYHLGKFPKNRASALGAQAITAGDGLRDRNP